MKLRIVAFDLESDELVLECGEIELPDGFDPLIEGDIVLGFNADNTLEYYLCLDAE